MPLWSAQSGQFEGGGVAEVLNGEFAMRRESVCGAVATADF